jgi:hypothetical protein
MSRNTHLEHAPFFLVKLADTGGPTLTIFAITHLIIVQKF